MLRSSSRYTSAIIVGAAVTFGLLFLMQYMIASGRGNMNDNRAYRIVDFVRIERSEEVKQKERKPDPPPEPELMPQMPEPLISTQPTNIQIAMVRPPVTMNTGMDGLGFGMTDGEYLPVTKPPPMYPPRAAQSGIQGYVIVEYTVTTTGETRDVAVVESTNSVFDRAAVESAKKYKYLPRMIDGTPIEVSGVRTKIEFVLED